MMWWPHTTWASSLTSNTRCYRRLWPSPSGLRIGLRGARRGPPQADRDLGMGDRINVEVAATPLVGPGPGTADGLEVTGAREARAGDMTVRRLLPLRLRRSVGAWCLSTTTGRCRWTGWPACRCAAPAYRAADGDLAHGGQRAAPRQPGQRADDQARPAQPDDRRARGIAHAEESPATHDPQLHGIQLWVALPDADRQAEPAFEHHADLPGERIGGFLATVFMGSLGGARSPPRCSPTSSARAHRARAR